MINFNYDLESHYGGIEYFKLTTDNGSVTVSTSSYRSNQTYTPSESIRSGVTYADFIIKPDLYYLDFGDGNISGHAQLELNNLSISIDTENPSITSEFF